MAAGKVVLRPIVVDGIPILLRPSCPGWIQVCGMETPPISVLKASFVVVDVETGVAVRQKIRIVGFDAAAFGGTGLVEPCGLSSAMIRAQSRLDLRRRKALRFAAHQTAIDGWLR